MTRKHFAALAWELRRQRQEIDAYDLTGDAHYWATQAWDRSVSGIANVCAESNGNFDRDRFLIAAGFIRRPDGSMYPMAAPR